MQTVICMKWGNRYSSKYVNTLYKSVQKHTKKITRLICYTDDSNGINQKVICKPLPKIKIPKELSFTPWRKLSVWNKSLFEFKEDILFLDLDLVITGNLDRFFDYKIGEYCVIENWTQKGLNIGNTSCFKLPTYRYSHILENFEKNSYKIFKRYKIEQNYISKEIKKQNFWPSDWCKSFKHDLLPSWPKRIWEPAKLPKNTSIVAFTGKPDPDDVVLGKWPVPISQFYKKIYKQLKTPDWVNNNWS